MPVAACHAGGRVDSASGKESTLEGGIPPFPVSRRVGTAVVDQHASWMSPGRVRQVSGATRTILVVDDEPQLLRLIVRVLERAGFTVIQAADGDSAIERLVEHDADLRLVVLDVIIPPAGGKVVLEEIAKRKPGLPVILVSGDQLRDEMQALMNRVDAMFLRKPFAPKALVRLVNERIEAAGSDPTERA